MPSKKVIRRFIVGSIVCAAGLVGSAARAQTPASQADVALDEGDPRVHVELLVDATAVRVGDTFRAGVLFRMDPGWHVYYRNPGDGALATEVVWASDEVRLDPLAWPTPQRFAQQNDLIVNFGYADEVLLFSTGHVREDVARSSAKVRAELDFLVCKVDCIPARVTLERAVTLGETSAGAASDVVATFDRFAKRVPVPPEQHRLRVETVLSQSAVRPGDTFRVAVGVIACSGPRDDACPRLAAPNDDPRDAFVPERVEGIALKPIAVRAHPNAFSGLLLDLEGKASPDDPGRDQELAGILHLTNERGEPLFLTWKAPLPRARENASVTPTKSALIARTAPPGARARSVPSVRPEMPFAQALWFSLLGGLLLNFMPCVFPVLAIKAAGLTRLARAEGGRVSAHACAYAAGILGSLLALAGVVVLLRASGQELGWGFHLQDPLFVSVLAAVLVILSLSLFGVLHVGLPSTALAERVDQSHGLARSVGEGVLAVVVATPCTAPFLGAAVGLAFASDAPVVLAVFAAVGVGLAAPVLLLALAPRLARFLPKPGPFLIHLERIFGFVLLGTVVWLTWLVGRTAGVDGMGRMLAFLLVVACATYLVAAARPAKRAWRGVLYASVLVAVLACGWLALRFDVTGEPTAARADDVWKAWSQAAVDEALAENRIVFIDFTADWCVTCKINESLVLEDEAVRSAFEHGRVATFKADWTLRDDRIGAELARHGRAGVPMYLVISPSEPQRAEVLPELLTIDIVLSALRRAAAAFTT